MKYASALRMSVGLSLFFFMVYFMACTGKNEETTGLQQQQSTMQQEPSPTELNGAAVKGPFVNADVQVFVLSETGDEKDLNMDSVIDDHDILVQGKTDESGNFSLKLPSNFSGPVKVVVKGMFMNEATGVEEDGELTAIKEVEAGKKHDTAIDVFSDLAAASAVEGMREGQKVADALESAHLKIAAHFGLPSDYMDKIPADMTKAKSLDPEAIETKLAIVSAALTQLTSDKKMKVSDLMKALRSDFSRDGEFDGKDKDQEIHILSAQGGDTALSKDLTTSDLGQATQKYLDENEHNKSGLKSSDEKVGFLIGVIKKESKKEEAKVGELIDKKEEIEKQESKLDDKKDSIEEKATEALGKEADQIEENVKKIEDVVSQISDVGIKEEGTKKIEEIKDKVDDIQDSIDHIKEAGKEVEAEVKAKEELKKDALEEKVADTLDKKEDKIEESVEKLEDVVSQISNVGIKEEGIKKIEEIKDKVDDIQDSIEDLKLIVLEEKKDDLEDAGAQALKRDGEELAASVKKLGDVASHAEVGMNEEGTKKIEAIKDIVEEIKDLAKTLKEADDVSDQAKEIASDAAQIHEVVKEMAQDLGDKSEVAEVTPVIKAIETSSEALASSANEATDNIAQVDQQLSQAELPAPDVSVTDQLKEISADAAQVTAAVKDLSESLSGSGEVAAVTPVIKALEASSEAVVSDANVAVNSIVAVDPKLSEPELPAPDVSVTEQLKEISADAAQVTEAVKDLSESLSGSSEVAEVTPVIKAVEASSEAVVSDATQAASQVAAVDQQIDASAQTQAAIIDQAQALIDTQAGVHAEVVLPIVN